MSSAIPATYPRILVPQVGAASVLTFDANASSAAEPALALVGDDILVKVAYAGINYIDTYFRSGLYKKPLPFSPGQEGSGVVVAHGPSISAACKARLAIGSAVAFYACDSGSYAGLVKVQSRNAFVLPASFDLKTAAALLLQGLTAHYLTHDTFPVKQGDTVLVHAAAGGTGLLVSQMAKNRGATVIGVCGGAEKAELAKTVGKCDVVIDYKATPAWEAEVLKATGNVKQCAVVYDGVGKSTFRGSLSCLKPRGMMVSFGNASGAVEPIAPLELTPYGSVSLCRPTLGDYMLTPEEREGRVADLIRLVESGAVQLTIGAVLPLEKAADAHQLLEAQRTTGKILLAVQ